MPRWTGIVLAVAAEPDDAMASRLVTYLHPVAGRPLLWHTAAALAALDPPPAEVVVLAGTDLPPELFQDLAVPVRVVPVRAGELERHAEDFAGTGVESALVATGTLAAAPLQELLGAGEGSWLPAGAGEAAAALVGMQRLPQLLRLPEPMRAPSGVLAGQDRLEPEGAAVPLLVRSRADLARLTAVVRDRVVAALMEGGVTFLLPDSVLVDVDVRIGRDSVVYPGAILEGHTTIGDETVIGPGCHIVDSWVGSGVELKGWNFISRTSVRNRAILEPYVRRGFD